MERQSSLVAVQETVVQVAEAIATVLKMDVTIIDNGRRRIAATGKYSHRVDTYITHDSIFNKALNGTCNVLITDTFGSIHCQGCSGKKTCSELAHLCHPIHVENQVVGLISLIAFTDEQRQRLLAHQDDFANFIGKMANLIASKILEKEAKEDLFIQKRQLEAIIQSVSEGIIAIDCQGSIGFCNNNAASLLAGNAAQMVGEHIDALFPNSNLLHLVRSGKSATMTLLYRRTEGKQIYLLVTVTPIARDLSVFGAVVTIRSIREVYEMATTVSAKYAFCGFDSIIGGSRTMDEVIDIARRAAAQDSTILIQGESGTGKELMARAIHQESLRRDKPFVTINCGAIPDNLLESELFGYEEGAFTGSKTGGKPGKLELADGGTIFLDEIGDMPLGLQVKILRFLQDNCLERLGGIKSKRINVRIIAATHRDLELLMKTGQFREDLYYRLSVVPIEIPPLRKREEEIPLITEFFLNKYSQIYGKQVSQVHPQAQRVLNGYHWPGNIRELENCIEYAVNMVDGIEIFVEHLPKRIRQQNTGSQGNKLEIMPLEEMEKKVLTLAWERYGGTEEGTLLIAQDLKISRATVYRKLKKYGIL